MKKHVLRAFTTLSWFASLLLLVPTSALAVTTLSFSPASIEASEEEEFVLTVSLDPRDMANYTVRVELRYPADLLEARSFTFADDWIPLLRPGYDSIDNTNGILVKTAGYAEGFSSPLTFGTVSFFAKKAGIGVIAVGKSSVAFNAVLKDVLSDIPAQVVVEVVTLTPLQVSEAVPAGVEEAAAGAENLMSESASMSPQADAGEELAVVGGEAEEAPDALFDVELTPGSPLLRRRDSLPFVLTVLSIVVILGFANIMRTMRKMEPVDEEGVRDEK